MCCVAGRDRFEKEFDGVQDVFELQVWLWLWFWPRMEFSDFAPACPWGAGMPPFAKDGLWLIAKLQRNLNNAFAYDLVPSPSVITAALKAARRVNDYPTAVRIFEGTS